MLKVIAGVFSCSFVTLEVKSQVERIAFWHIVLNAVRFAEYCTFWQK